MIHQVSSLDIPELAPYRTLRRPEEHYRQRIFVAEGAKVVHRLLDSNLEVISILLTREWYERLSPPDSILIYIADQKLLETIVGYRLHQGVMAVARMPQEPSLASINPRLIVALDGLIHAENVGVIVRNCAAFGADAVIVDPSSSSPYLRRAVRNSMGTVFRMPILHVPNLAQQLSSLRPQFQIAGADPAGIATIYDVELAEKLVVVFGNEGEGISSEVRNICDLLVSIPMHHNTDSLNVASASAVFLYEMNRRERKERQD